jgi:hypothetical protein
MQTQGCAVVVVVVVESGVIVVVVLVPGTSSGPGHGSTSTGKLRFVQ